MSIPATRNLTIDVTWNQKRFSFVGRDDSIIRVRCYVSDEIGTEQSRVQQENIKRPPSKFEFLGVAGDVAVTVTVTQRNAPQMTRLFHPAHDEIAAADVTQLSIVLQDWIVETVA